MATATKSESKDIGSAFDLLGKSADIVKKNWKMFLVVNIFTILFTLGSTTQSKPNDTANQNDMWGGTFDWADGAAVGTIVAVMLIFALVALFFYAMSISLAVKASKGQSPTFSQLKADGKKFMFPLFGQILLIGFVIVIGLILFIIPGIFAIMRLIMAPYVMVNENLGIRDAMRRSNQLAKAHSDKVWPILGVSILVGILTSVLQIIPVVGVVAAVVLTVAWSLIVPLRYLQIKSL